MGSLVVALAAAGCDRSRSDARPAAVDQAPAAVPAVAAPAAVKHSALPSCALVTPAEISAALGIGELAVPAATVNGPVTICSYADDRLPSRVTIRFETGTSAASIAASRREIEKMGQRSVDEKRLGDAAYSTAVGKRNTVAVLVGTTQLAVTSSDPTTRLRSLAALVVDKLKR
ncbi:MAG TPA: hypothetical protein VK698_27405 [Kofleriaceae bacterium]|nr:hypothetical protein [Kofleriaceae bacterium]